MTYASEIFLVTLADTKVYLNILDTDYDAIIGQFIDASANIIEQEIGFNPLSSQRTEYYDGNGQQEMILRSAPVSTAATSLDFYIDSDHAFGADTKIDCSSGVHLRAQEGFLWYQEGFPIGIQNIKLTYTAGWTLANIPYDLRVCCYEIVGWLFQRAQNKLWNVQQQSYADGTISVLAVTLPDNVKNILKKYRRYPS
jgi:hypothetical protein